MKSSSSSTSLNLSSVARLPPRWPATGGTLIITPSSIFQPLSSGFVEGGAGGVAGIAAGAAPPPPARPPPRAPPPPPARTVHPVKSLPLKSDFQPPAVWAKIVGDVLTASHAASATHAGAPMRVKTDFMLTPSGLCIIHPRPFMKRRLRFIFLFQIVLLVTVVVAGQKSPRLSVAALKPARGLQLRLWAAEPALTNPTNIAVDERGRVWVLEGVNYRRTQRNQPDLRPAGDRIVILEDTDQNG